MSDEQRKDEKPKYEPRNERPLVYETMEEQVAREIGLLAKMKEGEKFTLVRKEPEQP